MSKLIATMKTPPTCAMQISLAIATGIVMTFVIMHFALPYIEQMLG
jgi:hypothetical protein